MVAVAGLAACGGDGEEAVTVSQAEYDEEAQRLCNQHGEFFSEAYQESRDDSDAEEAAFYRSDLIPRGRALINRLADFGFPADKSETYTASFNEALAALSDIEAEPYRYIDQRHNRELTPEEDLVNRFRAGLAGADVPC